MSYIQYSSTQKANKFMLINLHNRKENDKLRVLGLSGIIHVEFLKCCEALNAHSHVEQLYSSIGKHFCRLHYNVRIIQERRFSIWMICSTPTIFT